MLTPTRHVALPIVTHPSSRRWGLAPPTVWMDSIAWRAWRDWVLQRRPRSWARTTPAWASTRLRGSEPWLEQVRSSRARPRSMSSMSSRSLTDGWWISRGSLARRGRQDRLELIRLHTENQCSANTPFGNRDRCGYRRADTPTHYDRGPTHRRWWVGPLAMIERLSGGGGRLASPP
jgi:hypothetical protein